MKTRVVVLGAGPGGYVAALRAAQLGADVTVVEGDNVGGTCLNWGCIPSKVMVTTADMLRKLTHAETLGIRLEGTANVDMPALQIRKNQVIAGQARGIESLFSHSGIRLVEGYGRIEGFGKLLVPTPQGAREEIAWDHLILATGTYPTPLPGLPFDGERILSSDHALNLEAVPEKVVIVGGGVIGCEFACILAGFGSEVVLVEGADRILPLDSLEPAASKALAREMKKQKIRILTEKTVVSASPHAAGVDMEIGPSPSARKAGKAESITASHMLVCIGRTPNTTRIGLESVGLSPTQKGWISVNDRMETDVPGISAIGDVTGPERVMLAHVASMEGRIAAEAIMGMDSEMDYSAVPAAIFTHPEVASVGLTLAQAEERGFSARTDNLLFRSLGKAHAMGEIAGETLLVTEEGSGRVLGCHMVGPHVSDLVAEATLAIRKGLTAKDLGDTIHAHPTLAEVFGEAALKSLGMALHG